MYNPYQTNFGQAPQMQQNFMQPWTQPAPQMQNQWQQPMQQQIMPQAVPQPEPQTQTMMPQPSDIAQAIHRLCDILEAWKGGTPNV